MSGNYQVPLDRTANQPVTEGVHPFTIQSYEEGEGPKGPYWKFTLACNTPGEEGKNVFMICSLAPAARWRLELFLDAVNAPKQGNVTAEKFVGKKFRANITHEDYEGRPQARVGEMWPMSTDPKKAASPKANPAVKKVNATPAPSEAPAGPVAEVPVSSGLPQDAGEGEIPF